MKLSMTEINETSKRILSWRVNDMTKIKLKCWIYYAESRIKNGNEPIDFDHFTSRFGKQIYLDYIEHNFIDCEDLGGKERAIEVVQKWFAY